MLGEGAHVEVVHGEALRRDPELGGRLAHLARERVRREALRAASASRSRTRRSGRRSPLRRAAPSSRRSRTRRRRCAARGRARASRTRSRRHRLALLEAARRATSADQQPQMSGSSKGRCRRGEWTRIAQASPRRAERDRSRCLPVAAQSPAPAAASSHTNSASPTRPVSAATVTGVSCDAAALGSFPFRPVTAQRSVLEAARRRTPITGWCDRDADPVRDELRSAARGVCEPARDVVPDRPAHRRARTPRRTMTATASDRPPAAPPAPRTRGDDARRPRARRSSTARTRAGDRAR